MHHVIDIAEVARGFAITVDLAALSGRELTEPARDDRRIGTLGILPGPEHIEIAQANRLHAVGTPEHIRIKLVDIFGHGVG